MDRLLSGAVDTGGNGVGLTRALAEAGSAYPRSTAPPFATESVLATDDP